MRRIPNAIPLAMMFLFAVVRICLPNITQGISFAASQDEWPVDKSVAQLSLTCSFFLTGLAVASTCDNSDLNLSFYFGVVFADFKCIKGTNCTIF